MSTFSSPFFILRTPTGSYQDLISVLLKKNITLEEMVQLYNASELFKEAIYFASKDLYREFLKTSTSNQNQKKKLERILESLFSYYVRMTSRCTPFGLFACMSVGNWSVEQSSIQIKENAQTHVSFDMEFFYCALQEIIRDSKIKEKLKFYGNNTFYETPGAFTYIEKKDKSFEGKNFKRLQTHKLIRLKKSKPLSLIMDEGSGKSFHKLVSILTKRKYSKDDSIKFVTELIKSSILIDEFEPTISGDDYYSFVINKLIKVTPSQKAYKLKEAFDKISTIATDRIITEAITIEEDLIKLYPKIDSKSTFQVDSFRKLDKGVLSEDILKQLPVVIEKLILLDCKRNENNDFVKFEKAFFERYELCEVPLLEALDPKTGIGYGKTLNGWVENNINNTLENEEKVQFKLSLYTKAITEGLNTVDLLEFAHPPFLNKKVNLPSEMCVFTTLHNYNGKLTVNLKYATRNSITKFLGRFTYQENVLEKVNEIIKLEEDKEPEKLFAEIIHLPNYRAGNIAKRACIRKYEIPILTPSTAKKKNIIPLNDLYLIYRYGRIILWSKSRKKQILPRLGNAHNFNSNSLPVYHFLCDLQYAHEAFTAKWDWGILANQPYLPRISADNIIISPTIWNLSTQHLQNKSLEEKHLLINEFRIKYKLPKNVSLITEDNEVIIDFENSLSIAIIIKQISNSAYVRFAENLWDKDKFVCKSLSKDYTNETLIPLTKDDSQNQNNQYQEINISKTQSKYNRKFLPGSEWYYLKVYLNPDALEDFIIEFDKTAIQPLIKKRRIKTWFFIRYADPKFHIRVRLLLNHKNEFHDINTIISQKINLLSKKGLAQSMCLDTYNREIERYGKNNILLSEDFFFLNSTYTLKLILLIRKSGNIHCRHLMAACGVELIFKAFDFTTKERISIYKKQIPIENNYTTAVQNFYYMRYREDSIILRRYILNKPIDNLFESELNKTSLNYFTSLKKIINHVVEKIKKDNLSKETVALSYAHMFINRIIVKDTAFWEPLLYYYLSKINSSILAENENNFTK